MTTPLEIATSPFNPRDPAFRADPYPVYTRLRSEDPLHYRASHDDWVFTRFTDVRAVLADERFGHGTFPRMMTFQKAPEGSFARLLHRRQESESLLRLWMLVQNPPDHTRLRRVFRKAFTAQTARELRPYIEGKVEALLARVVERGQMDIIADLALPLPLDLICTVLGIPEEDRTLPFKQWSHELSHALDADVIPAAHERGLLAIAILANYFRHLLLTDRAKGLPPTALMAQMVRAREVGQITETEMVANCIVLFFAGHSTIQHLIGNGMLALLTHPKQLALLRADPSLISQAVQECLRYDGPVHLTGRYALCDVEWRGVRIREGQKINLLLMAANRDPEFVANPDTFDILREPARDLAFGHGIHRCVGIHLAPLVAEIAIGTMVRRMRQIELVPARLEWEKVYLVRGPVSLPVTFSA